MAKIIQTPDGTAEFPDDMPSSEMEKVLSATYSKKQEQPVVPSMDERKARLAKNLEDNLRAIHGDYIMEGANAGEKAVVDNAKLTLKEGPRPAPQEPPSALVSGAAGLPPQPTPYKPETPEQNRQMAAAMEAGEYGAARGGANLLLSGGLASVSGLFAIPVFVGANYLLNKMEDKFIAPYLPEKLSQSIAEHPKAVQVGEIAAQLPMMVESGANLAQMGAKEAAGKMALAATFGGATEFARPSIENVVSHLTGGKGEDIQPATIGSVATAAVQQIPFGGMGHAEELQKAGLTETASALKDHAIKTSETAPTKAKDEATATPAPKVAQPTASEGEPAAATGGAATSRIVSTVALDEAGNPVFGEQRNTAHNDINNPLEERRGFVVEEPDGKTRITLNRQEAAKIATEAGQVQGELKDGELHSHNLVPETLRTKAEMETPSGAGTGEGPGAAAASELKGPMVVAIKNEKVDEQRKSRGQLPLMSEAQKSNPKTWERVVDQIEKNPDHPKAIIDSILSGKKIAVSDEENLAILHEQIRLRNERDMESDRIADPNASEEERQAARERLASHEDALNNAEQAGKMAGTQSGRALQIRQQMIRDDYTPAGIERKMRAAVGGRPLNEGEIAQIKKLSEELQMAQAEVERLNKLNSEKEKTEAVDDAIKEIKGQKSKTSQLDNEAKKQAAIEGIKRRLAEGDKITDLGSYIRALAESFVRGGITERNPLNAALHNVLVKMAPEITPEQTMDLFSGYGDFKPFTKDAVKIKVSQLRSETQKARGIMDMMKGIAAKLSGQERAPISDEYRKLQKQANELIRKGGFKIEDPAAALKSSLDAIHTRLRNEIADLDKAIATREPLVKKSGGVKYDLEANALKAKRDAKKAQYDELFPKQPLTQAEQLARISKHLDTSIAQLESDIKSGKLYPEDKTSRRLTSPEVESKRSRLAALKEERETLRQQDTARLEQIKEQSLLKAISNVEKGLPVEKPGEATVDTARVAELKAQLAAVKDARNNSTEAREKANKRAVESVDDAIKELDAKLKSGELEAQKRPTKAISDELAAKKSELSAMQALRRELLEAQKPKRTPEEIALQSYKTRLAHQEADLRERIAAGNYDKPARVKLKLDAEAAAAQERVSKLKAEVERNRSLAEWDQKQWWEKALIHTAGIARAAATGGYHTFGKLFSWDAFKLLETPIREGVGAVIDHIPGMGKYRDAATMEAGPRAKALGEFYANFFTEGMKEAWRTLRDKGESRMKLEFPKGINGGRPVFWYDYVGISHSASKAPLKTGDFYMRLSKTTANAIAHGLDPNDPMISATLRGEAAAYADRAVLQNNNELAAWINSGFNALERANPKTGRVSVEKMIVSTALKTFFTKGVIKTPLNFLARTMEYNPIISLPRAAGKIIATQMRGIDNLTATEANAIYRLLSSGAIGSAVTVFAVINALKPKKDQVFGGYFQPRAKKEDDAVPFNSVRIGGKEMPHSISHNPFVEQAQFATSMTNFAMSNISKKDKENPGFMAGITFALIAQTSNAPVVSPIFRIAGDMQYGQPNKLWLDVVTGLIPQIVQNIAKDTDTEGAIRKPSNIKEAIEVGIPGLRQNVPAKEPPKKALHNSAPLVPSMRSIAPSPTSRRKKGTDF